MSIISSDVGPINDSDIQMAVQSGAIIFGFDISTSEQIERKALLSGILARTYKLIFKMTDDIKTLVGDMEMGEEENEDFEEVSTAGVQQVFKIKQKQAPSKSIAGLSVKSGLLKKDYKVELYRNDILQYDDLKIESLKILNKEVSEVKSGDECGLKLLDCDDIEEGDFLRFYKPIQTEKKFDYSEGILHKK